MSEIDSHAITAARLLAVDAVERAKSGHPGTALSLAPVAHLLFQRFIRHDPRDPEWIGRDRFVLSCGHASMLLYTQLFLTGYDVTLDDLKSFRTLHSRTPGHPEYGFTPGVDATTGPLGQGFAMAVGMAMAFKHQRAVYDPEAPAGESPFDRHVWVIASDGDLQEGASYETSALAGRHRLANLTVIYDDNDIQIGGSTSVTSAENPVARFESQGWRVSRVEIGADGDIDVDSLEAVLSAPGDDRPHIVVLKSEIAWPAPNARGTAASHGAPLGAAEVANIRGELGVSSEPFAVDEAVLEHTRRALSRGSELHATWDAGFVAWSEANPQNAQAWERAASGELPESLEGVLPYFEPGTMMATRDASGKVIQALAAELPQLMGGSADLAEPNRTDIVDGGTFLPEGNGPLGRNIYWGVRELGMAAAMNGMLLAGATRVYAGTFLVFSDFQRPAIRLAALMGLPAVYVWSHDSVALGQDGPTHQPIEHLAALRAMPNLTVIRPADPNETGAAWLVALEQDGPTGLALCRQPLKTLDLPNDRIVEGVRRGAYVVSDDEDAEVIIIGTGSELELALGAADEVRASGVRVRVVSMPSRDLFDAQRQEYREQILPVDVSARVVVEAASPFGWRDVVGDKGVIVGIDHFGASGPADEVLRECGMTVGDVVKAIDRVLAG
ncbi:transketolase [Actinomycetaceae bacterium L2_0104]